MQTFMRYLRARRAENKGFSLVELAVVALVILALLAIALPTFLGAQDSAQDRSAQSNLRNAVTQADVIRANAGDYTGATPAALGANEPAITFVAGTDDSTNQSVSVTVTAAEFKAASVSDSGTCYSIRKVATGAGTGVFYGEVDTSGALTCQGDDVSNVNTAAANW